MSNLDKRDGPRGVDMDNGAVPSMTDKLMRKVIRGYGYHPPGMVR